ncbi:hypothetical protein W911_15455 [Hyphomicrobium nitrativorans NL23]|uniref:Uncharacterized protein n=1 Tax=Hyphomicrobium nitrativorans NL23 TaxID=1029756 RepID=V5SIR6_9HYPH|nr:hypothetical protein [Hyphomicrobium nitrativorans]AHB50382.1 hypothetical protein W911_15455 [Hyphomicrobium nitrativorans NL23]
MTLAKSATRLTMTVVRGLGLAILLLAAVPIMLAAAPMLLFGMLRSLWRRADLWAFYEGDEEKRRKAEWDMGR